jgi:hypothetical protein
VNVATRKLHEALIRSTKGLVRAWEEWVVSQELELDLGESQEVKDKQTDSSKQSTNLPTRG